MLFNADSSHLTRGFPTRRFAGINTVRLFIVRKGDLVERVVTIATYNMSKKFNLLLIYKFRGFPDLELRLVLSLSAIFFFTKCYYLYSLRRNFLIGPGSIDIHRWCSEDCSDPFHLKVIKLDSHRINELQSFKPIREFGHDNCVMNLKSPPGAHVGCFFFNRYQAFHRRDTAGDTILNFSVRVDIARKISTHIIGIDDVLKDSAVRQFNVII